MTSDDDNENTPRISSDGAPRPIYQTSNSGPITPRTLIDQDHAQRIHILERTVEYQRSDVASLLASRRTSRWIFGITIPVLMTAIISIVLIMADKIAASSERVGMTAARIEALYKLIETLQQDVRDLRFELRKLGANTDKPAISIARGPTP